MSTPSVDAGRPAGRRGVSQTTKLQAVAIGAVLLVAAVVAAVVLLNPRAQITGNNNVSPWNVVATVTPQKGPLCTQPVSLPADTASVRLVLKGESPGPANVTMKTLDEAGAQLGSDRAAVDDKGEVTFGLPQRAGENLTLCWSSAAGGFSAYGEIDNNINLGQQSTLGKAPVAGDISLAYLRPGEHSVLSQVPTIAKRAALFRPGWVGPWTYYAVFLVMLLGLLAAVALLLNAGRDTDRLRKRVIGAVAVLAFVNAAMWALITPPFHAPDEYAHFSYVETLARGELPMHELTEENPRGNSYLPSTVAISQTVTAPIIQREFVKLPWSQEVEQNLDATYNKLRAGPDQPYGLTPAHVYTPAYYAPAVLAYKLAGSGHPYDQLLLVRLWSALLLAIGVVFAMLFVREMLPNYRWAPLVAGLAVAFEPMAAHIGGSASNDNLMIAASAAALWLAARLLRQGVSFWTVFSVALAVVVGFAAKATALGVAPAVAFALLVAILRAPDRWQAIRTSVLACIAPLFILATVYLAFGPGGSVDLSGAATARLRPATPTGLLSYIWQWYLPAIGSMDHYWQGIPPAFRVFFGGFVSDFNSLDTNFPDGFYVIAILLASVLLFLSMKAVWDRRKSLGRQWPTVALPVIAIAGTVSLIHITGYMLWTQDGQQFAQGRYLFPLLAVFGLYVVTAGIGAGKRWALPLSSAIVIALASINIAGMALSLGRFYL